MTTMIDNFSESARRGLCFAMSLAIVTFALTIGQVSADAAYSEAARAQVEVVQLA